VSACVIAAGMLITGWAGPAGAAGPVVRAYTNPSISGPQSITAGPDGALWFINENTNSIGRVTTAGTVTTYTDPTISSPAGITAGPDGALWFTNFDNTVGRVTTAGTVTNYTDPTISSPAGITAGPDGALWFVNDGNDSVGRITTAGTVTNYTDPTISSPAGITAGPDGALWFTNFDNNSIGRITTAGTVTTYTDTHISGPSGIAAGPDGALWFTNFDNNSIGRITTAGTVTTYTDPTIAAPADITAGPDGALWFTNFDTTSIGRITTPASPVVPPNAPTAIRAMSGATRRATGTVTVSYQAGAPKGSPVTTFTATCTSNDGGTTRRGVHHGPTNTPITVAGVTTKKRYRCTVAAANAQGSSPPSSLSNTVTVGAPGQPAKPKVSRLGTGHLKLSFTDPSNDGSAITSLKAVCRSSNGGEPKAKTGPASPIGMTGLTPAKSYTCTVAATNRRGVGPASIASAPITV